MADRDRAIFEIHIRGTIDEVWRQITKTDEPQECFFNMYMDAPGGSVPRASRPDALGGAGYLRRVRQWIEWIGRYPERGWAPRRLGPLPVGPLAREVLYRTRNDRDLGSVRAHRDAADSDL